MMATSKDLDDAFERHKREQEWKEEMEKVIKEKESRCIGCYNFTCSCTPRETTAHLGGCV